MHLSEDVYEFGSAIGLLTRLYAPDGKPWCTFSIGLECINGDECLNHNREKHVIDSGDTTASG